MPKGEKLQLTGLRIALKLVMLFCLLLAGCENQPGLKDKPSGKQEETAKTRGGAGKKAYAFEQAVKLGKGMNLGNALEAPNEGDWGVTLQEEDFDIIRHGGFDTVRVPIKWSNHALPEAPYTVDESFFARVDWVIENALARKMNVVINMHHYDEIYKDPEAHIERFLGIWKQIAERYKAKSSRLYLELLNEPFDQLTKDKWNPLLQQAIHAIRTIDSKHTLIVGGADWNSIGGLEGLELPEEETNLICTFHYYNPFLFTHQGAEWVGPEYGTTGVAWPGPPAKPLEPVAAAKDVPWVNHWFRDYNEKPAETNPAGPKPLLMDLDQAAAWSKRSGRPLWVGEFGSYNKADMQSRVNWTSFIRTEFEKRGFTWAYWEYSSGFGAFSPNSLQWHEELRQALIGKPPK